ncbi:PPC domain-containing protein [Spirosoma sp. KUDC1026]|uniref:PPC domain-containing protein n=1 Tax=Spirosoma sp. KUDC1026 TaxID=2745947 RepID=UPI00159BBC9C|nr:PPC domain-containing protein [Spirosoma sp. KUDC1026]QKZ12974.1 hypothetical protein HU175_10145 [Spirosoma sp. KUDC1026]
MLVTSLLGQTPKPATKPIRVHFERGAITAQIKSQLTEKQEGAYYLVDAKAGQQMVVHTAGLSTEPIYHMVPIAVVYSPSGKYSGDKGPINFDEKLTETGTYTIRVARNQMASNVKAGPYLLEIIIR